MVGLNVTVRWGFGGIDRLAPDMEETSGVVSVELDAIATQPSLSRRIGEIANTYKLCWKRDMTELLLPRFGRAINGVG